MIGDRYTLPAGIWNSVMSVSHFSLGAEARQSRLMMFSGAGLISPRYEAYRRFLGFGTTRCACFRTSADQKARSSTHGVRFGQTTLRHGTEREFCSISTEFESGNVIQQTIRLFFKQIGRGRRLLDHGGILLSVLVELLDGLSCLRNAQ